jgi:nitroimidazol reductase NimA-like FMN-containing flavoprotein (pyridoxamine 5'-phosphate oxidase superfamily)
MSAHRTTEARKKDVLATLGRQKDVWLATADRSGRPHIIAVSAWWDGEQLVVTTRGASRTARNLAANRLARLALGSPDDATLIDVAAGSARPVGEEEELAEGFKAAVGWDPRTVGEGWVFIALEPVRIQAYKGYDEIEGRDVMKASRWLA